MSVCAVVGGQFGSEGKGLIVGHIAKEYDHHVRVGAANAGHTVYTRRGEERIVDGRNVNASLWEKHVMQQIPCAAYANPDAKLYIGPGALLSMEIFDRELRRLHQWRQERGLERATVFIDPRAHVITDKHILREQLSGLAERIGSTSTIAKEGIGAAAAARVMRDIDCVLAGDWTWEPDDGVELMDVPMALGAEPGRRILLEGTQGTGLSNTTGAFPYTTSRNTTAAGLCADAGIGPTNLDSVILVCRTFPIRVAGPSGPFAEGSEEIEWGKLGVDPENERTTVTKKIRRVATLSIDQIVESVILNGATEIALTFCDYLDPMIAGQSGDWSGGSGDFDRLIDHWKVYRLAGDIEAATGVPVRFLGTGPHSVIDQY